MSFIAQMFGCAKKDAVVPTRTTPSKPESNAPIGTGYRAQLKLILDALFFDVMMPKELISIIHEYIPRLAFTMQDMSESGLKITNDGLTVEYVLENAQWSSARAEYPLATTGVVHYEVFVDSFVASAANYWGISIGVVTTECVHKISPPSFCVGNKESFAFLANGQKCYDSGGGYDFSFSTDETKITAKTGDRVRVQIDHNKKTVDFMINGVSPGPGFSVADDNPQGALSVKPVNWPADSLFYPAVSLTLPESKLTLIN